LLNLPLIILVSIFVNVTTLIMLMLYLEQARGPPTWSLRVTWCPREPRWWPLTKMRADNKGPHLDFSLGGNSLSHGSVTLYANVERFFLW